MSSSTSDSNGIPEKKKSRELYDKRRFKDVKKSKKLRRIEKNSGNKCDKKNFYNNPEPLQSTKIPTPSFVLPNSHESQTIFMDQTPITNSVLKSQSPKQDEKTLNKIKNENTKADYSKIESNVGGRASKSPKNIVEVKVHKVGYCGDTKNTDVNIKKEVDRIKMENHNIESDKYVDAEDQIQNCRSKRSSSDNCSPFKDKKRKKMFDEITIEQSLTNTNQDRLNSDHQDPFLQKPLITKIYYSYFERQNDDKDEIRELKYVNIHTQSGYRYYPYHSLVLILIF